MSKKLFLPKYINNPDSYIATQDVTQVSLTNQISSGTFRREINSPLKSTQQLNIDYSKLENHTFFHSAVVKINESFEKITNDFPFDGSLQEIEGFEDTLTGFEKYVYDIYPKNVGYLIFSGTQKGESGHKG